jgi:predicted Zn finger-like uncharacterized protein
MRLTCPNCSARYEVDDSLVPPEGRDVQCSNCATTWFQPGNRARIEEPENDSPEAASAEPASDELSSQGPVRRELDPAIRDLLREEREREETLRHGGVAGGIEAQEEMALNDPATDGHAPETEEGEDEEDAETLAALRAATAIGTAAAATPSGRDLLPDIEEINSTLRATTDRNAREMDSSDIYTIEAIPRRRRGFRLGFILIVALAALAVGAYTFAPEISEAVPQAGSVLETYVGQVDVFRFWLDDLVQGLAERLSSSTGQRL